MATQASSRRLDLLAQPKSVPEGFFEDKRSVYWDCKIAKDWTNGVSPTTAKLSPRLEQLTQPKNVSQEYVGDRPTPIWQVAPAAMKTNPSARLETLSSSKPLHREYEPPKNVHSVVTDAAKSANASQRVENLSKPKDTPALPTNQPLWEWCEWESPIIGAARNASPSDHILQLAVPKKSHRGYKECRQVQWTVPEKALKALPSLRIQQLARPKSRSQYVDHYDDSAYKVSSAAKHAQATPRMQELCEPIPRKVKQKKT